METLNADYIETQYRLWKENPEALSSDWRFFFKGFELGGQDDFPTINLTRRLIRTGILTAKGRQEKGQIKIKKGKGRQQGSSDEDS